MPKILVWKCPKTGKLYEAKDKYVVHLKKLAKQNRVRRKFELDEAILDTWWNNFRDTEMSLEQLFKAIIENQNYFWNDGASVNPYDWQNVGKAKKRKIAMPVPELVEFTQDVLRWSNEVSNTHSCPRNGVQNWGRKLDKPTGYPGWTGRLAWKVKWPKEFQHYYLGGDLFDGPRSLIHTGTGGGGGWVNGYQSFSYDVKIFADDWPGLSRHYEKQKAWKILSTKQKEYEYDE
jgi:hypothetical protein